MKHKDVFDKIGESIRELSDQYEYLDTVKDNLNDLELELFIANAHFLTEYIEILCKLNRQKNILQQSSEKSATTYGPKYFEPVVQQAKHFEATEPKPANSVVKQAETESQSKNLPEQQSEPKENIEQEIASDVRAPKREEPETIRYELILDESLYEDDDDEAPLTYDIEDDDTVLPAPKEVKQPGSKNVEKTSDRPVGEAVSINQKISSQLGNTAMRKTEQLSKKHIEDIKLVITLNDKLLYIKDLFNGYSLAYSEAIEILNRFNTFEEASHFLKTSYATKNNWENKKATAEKFYELLRRRYI
ncbi:MAG TPA: hypothetical protein VGI43_18050 [Mucilaginibacter sp.]|jgi:hypothetical protein